jgi:hypothetical protein
MKNIFFISILCLGAWCLSAQQSTTQVTTRNKNIQPDGQLIINNNPDIKTGTTPALARQKFVVAPQPANTSAKTDSVAAGLKRQTFAPQQAK